MRQDGAAMPRVTRPLLVALGLLALLTLGEMRLYEWQLYEGRDDYSFVLANIDGILDGHPVSKSWQHRFLAPATIATISAFTGDRLTALKLFDRALLVIANLLLFVLTLRKGRTPARSLATVALFGLARALAMYRLQYPWDDVDIVLFIAFGYWVAKEHPLYTFIPLLLIGTLNHETILYVPLYYLLSPIDRPLNVGKREILVAALAAVTMGSVIVLLRNHFYVGPPNWPGQELEASLPLVSNHQHIVHNLKQLLFANWISRRAFVSATVLLALAALVGAVRRRRHTRAAVWTLTVFATIVCFGYVNETRHYLLLISFWFALA
jgi:hypothetical protein